MDPVLKNLIRVGIVSSVNASDCTARVAFEDRSDVVSYELPVLVRGSLHNKDYWMPDPGEQVICIFLPSGNARGFILGSIYSEKDKPPVADSNKRHITFSDGTVIEYDRKTSTLKVDVKGPINIVTTGQVEITASGITVNGNITATGDVKAGGVSLKTHVHSGVTSGTESTGPPEGGA
ncbi:MAG: phage baseplate assembly protein V [Desulfotomaculum sp.]|nr:phage baseplate assembly protein V [Desulfotomaculum sp.]